MPLSPLYLHPRFSVMLVVARYHIQSCFVQSVEAPSQHPVLLCSQITNLFLSSHFSSCPECCTIKGCGSVFACHLRKSLLFRKYVRHNRRLGLLSDLRVIFVGPPKVVVPVVEGPVAPIGFGRCVSAGLYKDPRTAQPSVGHHPMAHKGQ